LEDDPFSQGNLWSFNYFFFNRQLKRIIYFTCIAKSKYVPVSPLGAAAAQEFSEEEEEEPEEGDFMGDIDEEPYE
jgi:hypothetical protein